MKWINVKEQYLDYLRTIERRIPRTDYGTDRYKPFFGILFEVGELYYVTQVSHASRVIINQSSKKIFIKFLIPKTLKD